MRLYNGKLLKGKTQKQIAKSREMRDAVIIDVTPASKYCRVKIQGSETLIKAYYPDNWESIPFYLKPGNCVRITSPGGKKGRPEVSGCGFLLPTKATGMPHVPTPSALIDTIMTGCTITATNPASMSVFVLAGTYRISGVIYATLGMQMDSTSEMNRLDMLIDSGNVSSPTFSTASLEYYRYDTIVIGTNGIIDIVEGEYFIPTGTIPDPPDPPASHLKLGHVLIPPNITSVTTGEVNKYFSAPIPNSVYLLVDDSELAWDERSTTLTIGVKDQYGNFYSNPNGWEVTIAWGMGTGTLKYGTTVVTNPNSFVFYHTALETSVVTYTRLDAGTESSPMLTVTIASVMTGASAHIQLINIDGDKI